MRKLFSCMMAIAAMLVAIDAQATMPSNYYKNAEGKSGQALLEALRDIVSSHTTISYDNLYNLYPYSDVTSDGYVWDMYSTAKFVHGQKQCGSYKVIGDCYNREHSVPQSWFNEASPMKSDAFHVYPTDGKVNNQRSNYPFGVCANGTTLASSSAGSALGKVGTSTYSGYTGKVFEPVDMYKGDFARTYFYMATAYNSKISSWSGASFAGNSYPGLSSWTISMFLEWNTLDPVSEKETTRNEVIYDGNGTGTPYKQGNRNPFIDYPELADYIWGSKNGTPWYPGATGDPTIVSPSSNSTISFGIVATGSTTSQTVTVKGTNLTKSLTVSVSGSGFTTSASTISASDAMNGKDITLYYAAPATAGTYSGTLTISSSECSTVSVPITVTAVSGIPAHASDLSKDSFTACWTSQGDATNYSLYVYQSNGTTLLSGYPKTVTASTGKYTVTGLSPLTTYYFKVKSDALESNTVEVTTLDSEHIIDIITDDSWEMTALRNQDALPVLKASVYTENVAEEITLSVEDDNDLFDISLDRTNWSKQLTIDSDGETFYIRLNDVSTIGTFSATLTASSTTYSGDEETVTATVSRGENLRGDVNDDGEVDIRDLNCIISVMLGKTTSTTWSSRDDVNGDGTTDTSDLGIVVNIILGLESTDPVTPTVDPTTYVEDFEDLTTGGYWTKTVQCNKWKWNFTDAGIWGDTKKHGLLNARLGKESNSAIEMAEDITTGADSVSFYIAAWSSSEIPTVKLEYSTNSGSTWTTINTYTVNSTSLKQYIENVNIAGNVRFRIVQTSGERACIDDFTVVDNPNAKAAPRVQPVSDWDAVATGGAVTVTAARSSKVTIYNLDAEQVARFTLTGTRSTQLPAGTYIVAVGNHSKKVIVK